MKVKKRGTIYCTLMTGYCKIHATPGQHTKKTSVTSPTKNFTEAKAFMSHTKSNWKKTKKTAALVIALLVTFPVFTWARPDSEQKIPLKPYSLSLQANLLRWATLTPDLGVEWSFNDKWSLFLGGSYTSWSWDNANRRHALWEVSPELRRHFGRYYVGAMLKAGSFNYKFSTDGRQGDILGGGLTGGYRLNLSEFLSLDFSLGIGCLSADYENYTLIDGVRVRRGDSHKNWWGPTSAGVTLVWTIF